MGDRPIILGNLSVEPNAQTRDIILTMHRHIQEVFSNVNYHVSSWGNEINQRDHRIAALEQKIDKLESELDAAIEGLEKADSLITQLQAKAFQSSSPNSELSKLKTATPDTFDGDRSKYKDWKRQIDLALAANPKFSEAEKIIFILSYMKGGTAGPFADAMMRASSPQKPLLFDDFHSKLVSRFHDPNLKITAQQEIQTLMQGNDRAEEFVQKFEALEADAGFDQEALITFFKRAIKRPIRQQLSLKSSPPITLEEWKIMTIEADKLFHQFKREEQFFTGISTASSRPIQKSSAPITPKPTPPKPTNPFFGYPRPAVSTPTPPVTLPSYSPATKDPNAMDVDRTNQYSNPRPRSQMICYRCRKPGHRAIECPEVISRAEYDEQFARSMRSLEEQKWKLMMKESQPPKNERTRNPFVQSKNVEEKKEEEETSLDFLDG